MMNKQTGDSKRNQAGPEIWNDRESRAEADRARAGVMAGARLRRINARIRKRTGTRLDHPAERGCMADNSCICCSTGRHSRDRKARQYTPPGIGSGRGKAVFTSGTGMGFDSGRDVPVRSARSPDGNRADGERQIRVYPKFFRRIHSPR